MVTQAEIYKFLKDNEGKIYTKRNLAIQFNANLKSNNLSTVDKVAGTFQEIKVIPIKDGKRNRITKGFMYLKNAKEKKYNK